MDADGSSPATVSLPRRSWWLPVVIFLGGALVGMLVIALLGLGTPDFQAYRDPGAAAAGDASSTPRPLTGAAEVNEACLRVINEAQDIQAILGNLEQVESEGDLQLIDDLVRQLQPIERRLAADLRECRISAADGTSTSPTPSVPGSTLTPSPTPTPSPT